MSNANTRERRPPATRRSWLFVPGADRAALLAGPDSGADVLIQEMEDFVPADRRPEARALCAEAVAAWRAAGALAAIRVNPFWDGGLADLEAAMAAALSRILPAASSGFPSRAHGPSENILKNFHGRRRFAMSFSLS